MDFVFLLSISGDGLSRMMHLCPYEVDKIFKIRKFLSYDKCKTLIHALVVIHLYLLKINVKIALPLILTSQHFCPCTPAA